MQHKEFRIIYNNLGQKSNSRATPKDTTLVTKNFGVAQEFFRPKTFESYSVGLIRMAMNPIF